MADKGYNSKKCRKFLHRRGIRYTTPYLRNEKHIRPINKTIYRERNKGECLFSRLKYHVLPLAMRNELFSYRL
ncbi:MAG: hypothetical protein HND51_13515 [Chloroflexi bacterium]|nr:hypothetical protein [Chloroflexota bacterium]